MVLGPQGALVQQPLQHRNHVAMLRRRDRRAIERHGEVLFQPRHVEHLFDANNILGSSSSSSSFSSDSDNPCADLVAQCCCAVCGAFLEVAIAECMGKCCLPAVEAGCTVSCRAVGDPMEDAAIYYCGEECADCGKAVGKGCCCAAGCAAFCWVAANGGITVGDWVNLIQCVAVSGENTVCAFH